jgi:hypothetical protein
MPSDGEIAAAERYWCGATQAAKRPGLMKEDHGELKTKRVSTFGKFTPYPTNTLCNWT